MKPHEEEWTWHESGYVRKRLEGTPAAWAAVDFADETAGRLGAAAPAMARALLRRLENETCLCHLTAPEPCTGCEDKAILRAARVLE